MQIKTLIGRTFMTTRRSLLAGFGSLAAVAVGQRRKAHADPALQTVKIVIPQDSVFVLNYLGAKDAGVFAKHGIDLDVDPRPFAGYLAGLPSKQCMVASYSGIDAIQKIDDGLDWVILGGGLTVVQSVIVRKDSPFKTPADLRGKKFGTYSSSAASFKCGRAAIIDAFKFDIVKDTQVKQVAGPALTKLLEEGQLDAMVNISSLSLAAEAETDKFRVLFSANDYWMKKTGYPIAWPGPLVAWRSWVDEDPGRAKKFAAAVEESLRWLKKPENLETAVKNHGALAGVKTAADVAEYKTWLQSKNLFMTSWNRKAVDAQWKFLQLCQRTGVISKVPAEDKYALFVQS
jgi:ABC-type nitrate/sulfonate/bicarbonate transport system substrate-binding protein